jgi:hypothetical protein
MADACVPKKIDGMLPQTRTIADILSFTFLERLATFAIQDDLFLH